MAILSGSVCMGVGQLSQADILNFAETFNRVTAAQAVKPPLLMAVSGDVLKHYLGLEWVLDNVLEQAPMDDHFSFGSEGSLDRYRYSDRVVSLAEMLFHFQAIDGFDARLEDLKTSSVETGVGELEGAKTLYMAGVPFKFIRPIGKRGRDFDVLIEPPDARAVNCEMKCKVSRTELSVSTVVNTLGIARSQLPSNQPGLIFVRLPEPWMHRREIAQTMGDALKRFFRGTSRVGAVALHWEEWYTGRGLLRARATRVRVEYSPSSPFASSIRSLELELNQAPARWTHFAALLKNHGFGTMTES